MNTPDVIAVTDCGSTTTKALLFERDGEDWRLKARSDSPTTVEAPAEDVLVGVRNALLSAGSIAGRKILDSEGRIIRPSDGRVGIDLFLSTSSAGGGLQVAVAGAVAALSARSAQRAALGAGAIVSGVVSLNEMESRTHAIQSLRSMEPDIVILSGGVDHGGEDQVVELSGILASSGIRPRYGEGLLPLVYAGNRSAWPKAQSLLEGSFLPMNTGNVLPQLNNEHLLSARDMIHEIFLDHVMKSAPGLRGLMEWVDESVLPTPAAVSRLLENVGKHTSGDVLAVDIGGATTDIFSWKSGILSRTVSANLGMSYSVRNVIEEAGMDSIIRWLPFNTDAGDVMDILWNKAARPTTIPGDMKELLMEQAVAREALRHSFAHHCSLTSGTEQPASSSISLGSSDSRRARHFNAGYGLIIGSGGVLSHAPSDSQFALMLLDSFEPVFLTEIAKDRVFMMPHLGVLSEVLPEAALDIFRNECLSGIAACFSPAGRIRQGKPCLDYELHSNGSVRIRGSMNGGEIERIGLSDGEKAVLMIVPSRGIDAGKGPGRPAEMEVCAGSAGIIIDCRGRPVILPEKDSAVSTVQKWIQSVDAGKGQG